MNSIAAAKSRARNGLEGFALVALLQGLPIFATAGMMLKLAGSGLVGDVPGLVIALASIFHAGVITWLGPKYPHLFRAQYDPALFDATLPIGEKITSWSTGHYGARRLVTNVCMLSLLAVAMVVR